MRESLRKQFYKEIQQAVQDNKNKLPIILNSTLLTIVEKAYEEGWKSGVTWGAQNE